MERIEIYCRILMNLEETYRRKNADYGNSVSDTYEKFGDLAFLVRITDKYNRIMRLTQSQGEPRVTDEKLGDTILDLANYCILWLVEGTIHHPEEQESDEDEIDDEFEALIEYLSMMEREVEKPRQETPIRVRRYDRDDSF